MDFTSNRKIFRLGPVSGVVIFFLLCVPLLAQANAFGSYVGSILLNVASAVTWLGGKLLETSIQWFVLDIGTLIGRGSPLGIMIENLWSLIRDICNLVFIFGFIYIGIRIILSSDDSSPKRMLASLIIGAILINFSLYFTRVIIDITNYTAVEIYDATFVGGPNDSLSAKFGKSLGLMDIYKSPDPQTLSKLSGDGTLAFYFMMAILLIVAGFVFAAGALLLLARFIILVFLMIFSPFLFAATVFQGTSGVASTLWKQLINSAIFAPAYLVLLLVSVNIISALTSVPKLQIDSNGIANALANGSTANSFSVILVFIVGIMVLLASLKVAKQFGFVGADKAMGIANSLRGRVQGSFGRNTVGRASNYLLKKYEKDDARIGQMKWNSMRGFSNKLVRKGLEVTGADQGIRKGLKTGKEAKFGSSTSFEDDKKWNTERDAKRSQINEYDKFKNAIKEGSGLTPTPAQKIAMERAIAGASVKYLEDLSQEERKKITQYMTQSQFDGIEKSSELSDTEKSELNEARRSELKKVYDMQRDDLMKASVDNLKALGVDFLQREDNAIRLNSSQMDDLKKKLTPTEFNSLSKARNDALTSLAQGSTIDGKDKNHILSQKAGELAKMPPDALKAVASELPVAALAKISQDGTLNKQDQSEIRQNITTATFANPNDPQLNQLMDFLDHNPLGKQFGN